MFDKFHRKVLPATVAALLGAGVIAATAVAQPGPPVHSPGPVQLPQPAPGPGPIHSPGPVQPPHPAPAPGPVHSPGPVQPPHPTPAPRPVNPGKPHRPPVKPLPSNHHPKKPVHARHK